MALGNSLKKCVDQRFMVATAESNELITGSIFLIQFLNFEFPFSIGYLRYLLYACNRFIFRLPCKV